MSFEIPPLDKVDGVSSASWRLHANYSFLERLAICKILQNYLLESFSCQDVIQFLSQALPRQSPNLITAPVWATVKTCFNWQPPTRSQLSRPWAPSTEMEHGVWDSFKHGRILLMPSRSHLIIRFIYIFVFNIDSLSANIISLTHSFTSPQSASTTQR